MSVTPLVHALRETVQAELSRALAERDEALSILKQVSDACGPSEIWNGETKAFLERIESFLGRPGTFGVIQEASHD